MRKILYPILLLGVAVYFLPHILSTNWGKERVSALLEKQLGGQVQIEDLSLNWSKMQSCNSVRWTNKEKKLEAKIDKLLIQSTLLDLLTYKSSNIDLMFEGVSLSSPTKIGVLKKKKPMDLSIGRGLAKVQAGRIFLPTTLMMLNQKHLILLEGNVDFTSSEIDLQVGLPAETLTRMFGLKNLPEDYLLEIPICCEMSAKALEKKLFRAFLKNYARVTSLQR